MGCKRPIEEVESEELPFKHSRSLEFSNKPASFSKVAPCYNASQEHITEKDEGDICKLQWTEVDGKDTAAKPSTLVDNDFVIRNTFSTATNSHGEGNYKFWSLSCLVGGAPVAAAPAAAGGGVAAAAAPAAEEKKSKHDLKEKSQLIYLIRKYPEGIAVIDLKDSYPTVMEDLQALKEAGSQGSY